MNKQPYLSIGVITGLMLCLAITELPYGYYQFLRWIVCGVGILVAYTAFRYEVKWAVFVFGAVAVLFNPIFPIYLTREIWLPIDLVCGLFFFLSPNYIKKPEKNKE